MNHAYFKDGARVTYFGASATVSPLPSEEIALSFDHDSMQTVIMSLKTAEAEVGKNLLLVQSNKTVATVPANMTPEKMIEYGRRKHYVDELKKRTVGPKGTGGVKLRQRVIDYVRKQINDKKGVSPAQLARWAKAQNNHSQGVYSTMVRHGVKRKPMFSQSVLDAALQAVDDYFLQLGGIPVQFVYDKFVEKVDETLGISIKRPCYATFSNWVKKLDQLDVIGKCQGRRALKAAKRNVKQKIKLERILERVETDAVNLALGLIDNKGRYLGTVTLFVDLCCASRSVLGIRVQIGRGESAASVIDCHKHAIYPKLAGSYSDKAENTWPMHGVPELIVSDGGAGFSAINTQAFIIDCGGDSQVVESYAGWRKPFIERFFLTLRLTLAVTIPGYCGKHTDDLHFDATVKEQACLTYAQFYDLLTHWIVDEYHQSPHQGLNGQTPHDFWLEQAKIFPPMLPVNHEYTKHIKGEVFSRVIQGDVSHKGVVINNVFYNDDKLKHIGMQLKARGVDQLVTCQYSPNDIWSITVIDPFTEEIFEVRTYDHRVHPGMSLVEFDVAYPPIKKKKGFGRKRVLDRNPNLEAAKKLHKKNMKAASTRKSQSAHVEEIQEQVEKLQDESPTVKTLSENTKPTTKTPENKSSKKTKKGLNYE